MSDDDYFEKLFCTVTVSRLSHFGSASTLGIPNRERQSILENPHNTLRKFIFLAFGRLMHSRLNKVYVDVDPSQGFISPHRNQQVLSKTIAYSDLYKITVGDLAASPDECLRFLNDLYGEHGSSFLKIKARELGKTVKFWKKVNMEMILPCTIIKAMVLCAKGKSERELSGEKGTRFFIDSILEDGGDLAEERPSKTAEVDRDAS